MIAPFHSSVKANLLPLNTESGYLQYEYSFVFLFIIQLISLTISYLQNLYRRALLIIGHILFFWNWPMKSTPLQHKGR